jgi:pilus assembly protein CpaF
VKGRFLATGIVPKCGDKLTAAGAPLPTGLADHSLEIG